MPKKVYIAGEDGKPDGRFNVAREWCGYPRRRWVMRFATTYRGSAEHLSDAWCGLLRWYSEDMDYKMIDLAIRRLGVDFLGGADRLREVMEDWPAQELANVAVGLCFEQTAYGMPRMEYCNYPALGDGTLYCRHHLTWRQDEGVGSRSVGMPNWLSSLA